jgi:hypothetical protein
MLSELQRGWLAALLSIGTVVATAVPASAQDAEAEADPDSTEVEGDIAAEVEAETDTEEETPSEPPDAEALAAPEAEAPADAAAAAAEEAPAPRPASRLPLSFANSYFFWGNYVNAWTFAPGAGQTYNPTYQMSFSLNPRFYLTDTTFLWLNQDLFVELTDADDATYNREPMLGDTLLDIRQNLMVEGFVFQFQGRLGFPLSKLSQAARRVMQTGLGIVATRPIPEAANLTISTNVAYRRWWALSNVPIASPSESQIGYCSPSAGMTAGEPTCTQASGATSLRDIIIAGLTLSVAPLPELTIMLQGMFIWGYGHELAPGEVDINGGTVVIEDQSRTHWRNFTYLMLAVAYDVQPWLNIQLGIANTGVLAPLYSPDGSVRGPFNADTQVFLNTTITIDSLYQTIFPQEEGEELTPEERNRRRQGLASRDDPSSF